MTDILMPALSPTMEEGTLAKWHVKVGDTVKSGDVIAEIETDKATMEVEAVDEGVVAENVLDGGQPVVANVRDVEGRGSGYAHGLGSRRRGPGADRRGRRPAGACG